MKYVATINGKKYEVEVERVGQSSLDRAGSISQVVVPTLPAAAPVTAPVPAAPAAVAAPAPAASPAPAGAGSITSPLAGKVLKINITPGQAVKFGEVVIILEAMKMETEIVAPADGTIGEIKARVGDMVENGTVLATMN